MVYGTSEYLPTVVPTIVLVLRTVLVPTRKYFYGTYRMIVRRTYNSTYYVVLYYLYPILNSCEKTPTLHIRSTGTLYVLVQAEELHAH